MEQLMITSRKVAIKYPANQIIDQKFQSTENVAISKFVGTSKELQTSLVQGYLIRISEKILSTDTSKYETE